MEIKTTILPGQNGTKQLLRQYGEQLVCVRYRYDKARLKRFKTVELIIDEKEWIPQDHTSSERLVELRIGYGETGLREQVKAAGGRWDPEKKLWELSYAEAAKLRLLGRIVEE